jgi:hypothetical protein
MSMRKLARRLHRWRRYVHRYPASCWHRLPPGHYRAAEAYYAERDRRGLTTVCGTCNGFGDIPGEDLGMTECPDCAGTGTPPAETYPGSGIYE